MKGITNKAVTAEITCQPIVFLISRGEYGIILVTFTPHFFYSKAAKEKQFAWCLLDAYNQDEGVTE